MRITAETVADGVTERLFELEVADERVPGVVWTPAGASGGRPLVLMGHGGSQHKRTDTMIARAHRYVSTYGYAVAAIDAHDHGDRVTPERADDLEASIRDRIAEGRRLGREVVAAMNARATRAVPEWQAALDHLRTLDEGGTEHPVGYFGVSMGTVIEVPLVASEPRIAAAVLGLAGLIPDQNAMAEAAGRITVPIEFVLQSEDELVARDAGIALFDAFGSVEKTLHVNPGGHMGIPEFERASWERFFARHLS
jgi:dienelactone hydrolase